jgi:hypothetical protein
LCASPESRDRPRKLKKSPAPFVHAATKTARKAIWEAYAWVVAAFREAAEKLRAAVKLEDGGQCR